MSDRAPSPSSAPPTTALTRDEILAKWRAQGAHVAAHMVEQAYADAAASPPSPALAEIERLLSVARVVFTRYDAADPTHRTTVNAWRKATLPDAIVPLLTALRSSASALAEAERERGELRDLLRRARARAGEHDGRGDALRLLSRAIELLDARAALVPGHPTEGDNG